MTRLKKSYTDEETNQAYKCYEVFCTVNGNKTSLEKFKKFRYRRIFYELIVSYDNFGTVIPIEDYIKYLVEEAIPFNKWGNLNTFRDFVLIYTKEEDCEKGIERSQKFLAEKNCNIETISDTRLIMYLESGNVSPWLVLKYYPEFFDYVIKETQNTYVKNILSLYFWKLKEQREKVTN